ncbi:hypothetical protein HCU40_00225 [Pseudanabaena biceps]|nr:hypothetical protein [Pseudanabaena biceps]
MEDCFLAFGEETVLHNLSQEFFESVALQHFQKILGSDLDVKRCKIGRNISLNND